MLAELFIAPGLLLPWVSGHRGYPRNLSSHLALSFLLPGGSPRLLALPGRLLASLLAFLGSQSALPVGARCPRLQPWVRPRSNGGKQGWRAARWAGWEQEEREGLLDLPIPNSLWKVTAKLTWHNAEQFPEERCGRCSDNGGSLTCSWKGHVIKLLRTADTNLHHPSKLTCENI